jgi:hypothetical protein
VIPYRLLHFDQTVYGPNVYTFKPERFAGANAEELTRGALRKILNITAGIQSERVINGFALLGGGVLSKPDTLSGVNPAWRRSYMHNYWGRG